jgi:hypothetical protein
MEISGQLHAPAAVPPLPEWVQRPRSGLVLKVQEKRNSLPSLELETQTKGPHITKRRGDIRCPVSGMPDSYSTGHALKPRLETGYPEREFNDFSQTLHTNPGIIPQISPRPVGSTSFPTPVPSHTTQCAPYNHR